MCIRTLSLTLFFSHLRFYIEWHIKFHQSTSHICPRHASVMRAHPCPRFAAMFARNIFLRVVSRVGHPENLPPPNFRFPPEQGRKARGFAPNFCCGHAIIFRGAPDFSPGVFSSQNELFGYWCHKLTQNNTCQKWVSLLRTTDELNKMNSSQSACFNRKLKSSPKV